MKERRKRPRRQEEMHVSNLYRPGQSESARIHPDYYRMESLILHSQTDEDGVTPACTSLEGDASGVAFIRNTYAHSGERPMLHVVDQYATGTVHMTHVVGRRDVLTWMSAGDAFSGRPLFIQGRDEDVLVRELKRARTIDDEEVAGRVAERLYTLQSALEQGVGIDAAYGTWRRQTFAQALTNLTRHIHSLHGMRFSRSTSPTCDDVHIASHA